jgi:hypothetical protein
LVLGIATAVDGVEKFPPAGVVGVGGEGGTCGHPVSAAADLDFAVGLGLQVDQPGWGLGAPSVGGDDQVTVAFVGV